MSETNYIMEYHKRLGSMDPRVKEILVRYGDKHQTGRMGNNWKPGIIEYELWLAAYEVGGDTPAVFNALFAEAFPDRKYEWEMFWNILSLAYNKACKDFKEGLDDG